jgi:hypothetical protein
VNPKLLKLWRELFAARGDAKVTLCSLGVQPLCALRCVVR